MCMDSDKVIMRMYCVSTDGWMNVCVDGDRLIVFIDGQRVIMRMCMYVCMYVWVGGWMDGW